LIYLIRIALFYYTRSPSSDKVFLEFSDSLTREKPRMPYESRLRGFSMSIGMMYQSDQQAEKNSRGHRPGSI
jgi:hypothetical protein